MSQEEFEAAVIRRAHEVVSENHERWLLQQRKEELLLSLEQQAELLLPAIVRARDGLVSDEPVEVRLEEAVNVLTRAIERWEAAHPAPDDEDQLAEPDVGEKDLAVIAEELRDVHHMADRNRRRDHQVNFEIRKAALAAAAEVYRGRGCPATMVLEMVEDFEPYLRSGHTDLDQPASVVELPDVPDPVTSMSYLLRSHQRRPGTPDAEGIERRMNAMSARPLRPGTVESIISGVFVPPWWIMENLAVAMGLDQREVDELQMFWSRAHEYQFPGGEGS